MPDSNGNLAASLSRRALVRAGPATVILDCLSGVGGPAEANAPNDARRLLSLAFRRNAETFFRGALVSQVHSPGISFHCLAIATELSLKAYLLHRGVSDDWNRVHIGHDLSKALVCAKHVGFLRVPRRLPDLAASLTPYYVRHGFSRGLAKAVAPQLPQACNTVCGLLRGVAGQIDQEAASGDLMKRPRQWSVHA
jgi:hypothetical protein